MFCWMVMDNTTTDKAPPTWSYFTPVFIELLEYVPALTSNEIKGYSALLNQDKHLQGPTLYLMVL